MNYTIYFLKLPIQFIQKLANYGVVKLWLLVLNQEYQDSWGRVTEWKDGREKIGRSDVPRTIAEDGQIRLTYLHNCRYNTDMSTFDNIFKHIAGEFTQDFAVLALKTSEVEVTGRLNTEHITVKTHQSDMVYHVRLPDEEAILHIEAQTDDSTYKPMHLRMLAYASVLALEYEKNVYSTVLYFRPPAGQGDPGFYQYGNEDQGGIFRYNVIRIYELEGKAFLDPDALGVLSFTGLMKPPSDMSRKDWTAKCIETIRAADVDEKMRGTLLFAFSLFGSFVQPTELFQDPSLEAIMQKSPFYEHVIQRGREQGIEQGIEQGRIDEKRTAVLKVVRHKFADISDLTLREISGIDDLVHLDDLFDQVLTAKSFDDIDFSKNGK